MKKKKKNLGWKIHIQQGGECLAWHAHPGVVIFFKFSFEPTSCFKPFPEQIIVNETPWLLVPSSALVAFLVLLLFRLMIVVCKEEIQLLPTKLVGLPTRCVRQRKRKDFFVALLSPDCVRRYCVYSSANQNCFSAKCFCFIKG